VTFQDTENGQMPIYVINKLTSAVTASIFAGSSSTMNGTTAGSVVLTTGAIGVFVQTSAGVWYGGKLS
jgi:hypothetical protein